MHLARDPAERCTVPGGGRAGAGVRPGPLSDGAAAGRGAGRGGHGGVADRRVRAAAGARPRLRRPAYLHGPMLQNTVVQGYKPLSSPIAQTTN